MSVQNANFESILVTKDPSRLLKALTNAYEKGILPKDQVLMDKLIELLKIFLEESDFFDNGIWTVLDKKVTLSMLSKFLTESEDRGYLDVCKNVSFIIDKVNAERPQGKSAETDIPGMDFFSFDLVSEYKDDFRRMSIVPEERDFVELHPILRKNLVEGPYQNTDHYLETQFRLLREDFVHAHRKAVQQFRSVSKKFKNIRDPHLKHIRDANVYLGLTAVEEDSRMGNCSSLDRIRLRLPPNYRIGIDWQNSSKLQGGTFVSISTDNFMTFANGVIVEFRKEKRMADGLVKINFLGSTHSLSLRKPFVLIENSSAYYEAYAPTLKVIQKMHSRDVPLQRYIVHLRDERRKPSFLGSDYDFAPLKVAKFGNKSVWQRFPSQLIAKSVWPRRDETILNKQQYEAVLNAFNNELCVIQGPPGTGKTFVAKKIVEMQLFNGVTRRPILIVCYTNHALDQFLEGISEFTESILRFGGSSKNEAIERFVFKGKKLTSAHLVACRKVSDRIRHLVGVIKCEELLLAHEHNLVRNDMELQLLLALHELSKEKRQKNRPRGKRDGCFLRDLDRGQDEPMIEDTESEQAVDDVMGGRTRIIREKLSGEWADDRAWESGCVRFEGLSLAERWAVYRQVHRKFVDEFCRSYLKHCDRDHESPTIYLAPGMKCMHNKFASITSPTEITLKCLISQMGVIRAEINREEEKLNSIALIEKVDRALGCEVIGMTTSGAARNRELIERLGPQIVIVEEAAEVLEAHILACLAPSVEQLILIGDHQQLQPATAVHKLAIDFNLQTSMFERLVSNKISFIKLVTQHRMRDEIRELLVPTIYTEYNSHGNVFDYPDVKGMGANMFFMNHENPENTNEDTLSKTNHFEADVLLNLMRHFLRVGYKSSEITILSTYRGQVELMISKLKKFCRKRGLMNDMHGNDDELPEPFKDLRITTVDNYQGEENIIVLVSLVRSNDDNKIGFLSRDNRVCVALSRAKHGLFCIGNLRLLAENSKTWNAIMEKIEQKGRLGSGFPIHCEKHDKTLLMENSSEILHCGAATCDESLECGHVCSSECHFETHETTFACRTLVTKLCANGHEHRNLPCSRNFVCSPIRKLTCLHESCVEARKGPLSHQMKCSFELEAKRYCGHILRTECHELATMDEKPCEKCPSKKFVKTGQTAKLHRSFGRLRLR